jgi:hypothetical protein
VDGVENKDFRDSDELTNSPSTSSYGEVFMKTGTHRVVVEYNTNNENENDSDWDWVQNMLSVQYHRKVNP